MEGRVFVDEILKLKKEVTDFGYGMQIIKYINIETGEVECTDFKGSIVEAFKAGARSVPFKGFLGYEPTRNNNFFTLTEFETMRAIAGAWKSLTGLFSDLRGEEPKKKKRHKSGNKKAFVKVYLQKLGEITNLPDKDLGTLMKLAKYIDWDTGVLVDVRTKEPLDYKGLCKQLKYTEQTLNNRLKVLKDKDILTKDEEGYKINSEYISKG